MSAVEVLDGTRRRALPTGRVLVTALAGATDAELAETAGYDAGRHFGYAVTRHELDGTATVGLYND